LMELPAIVTGLALIEYMYFSFQVGMGRGKYGVAAPATSGNEQWERLYRVQQNTLEQLMVFLPALWLFAWFISPTIGALIGVAFLIGRIMYFLGYVADPGKRGAGFLIGFVACVILLLGGIGGAVYRLAM
jgi:glutathione S-transferase